MSRPHRSVLLSVTLAGAAMWSQAGCGFHHDRTALAIQSAQRPDGTVLLEVECADDIEIDQRPDTAGSGLVQVTVWGRPKWGRCHPPVGLDDVGGDRFVDGATSQVVEVYRSNPD